MFEPYENSKFQVSWDNRHIVGVSKVSALKRTTEVIEHREGGDPNSSHKSTGRTKYEPITLERGITNDRAFEEWANLVSPLAPGEPNVKDFRKGVVIDLMDEDDKVVLRYKVFRCWVSEYQALPALDADSDAVAIESITLENEGWERDPDVVPPQ